MYQGTSKTSYFLVSMLCIKGRQRHHIFLSLCCVSRDVNDIILSCLYAVYQGTSMTSYFLVSMLCIKGRQRHRIFLSLCCVSRDVNDMTSYFLSCLYAVYQGTSIFLTSTTSFLVSMLCIKGRQRHHIFLSLCCVSRDVNDIIFSCLYAVYQGTSTTSYFLVSMLCIKGRQ